MSIQHKAESATADTTARQMVEIGLNARTAQRVIAEASSASKSTALRQAADAIRANVPAILAANARDVEAARATGMAASFIDRLTLDPKRIEAIAVGLSEISDLPDPVGTVMSAWTRPNGMKIERVRVPIGVIGIIFESRPNVTADAGALCLKSGNAAILRGGSDSFHSSRAIHGCLVEGLQAAGLPAAVVQLVPTTDRAAVGHILKGLNGAIDVIVPRGGKSLVARVQEEARVPVFAHLEGICHTYVDAGANLEMASRIVVNAKMRRTGVCGSTETLLVDRAADRAVLPRLIGDLIAAGCSVRGDEESRAADPRVTPATEADWSTEYLDAIISARVVDGVSGAIDHIARYGSHHTDSIVTDNVQTAERFLKSVDSAIVLHNASTQFADGGEFGFGAEIGIATGRLHARGPVAVEQLTTFKYVIHGAGQTRP